MVYGAGKDEIGKIRCEGCREFVLQEIIKTIYGPDQRQWFDGSWGDRPHYFCPSCYEKVINQ